MQLREDDKNNNSQLNDFNNQARGVYLLPEWPDNVKYNYSGSYAQNARFGNLEVYKDNFK